MDRRITATVRWEQTAPALVEGQRSLHMGEGGYQNETNTPNPPEVRPSVNVPPIPFTEHMQYLSYAVMKRGNALITPHRWTAVFGDREAFCNDQGYGNPADPRANFVTGENKNDELPKLMKGLHCGGAFFEDVHKKDPTVPPLIQGDQIILFPGVHGVDANDPMPGVDEVFDRGWYFNALYVRDSDTRPAHFPMGAGGPVLVTLFLRQPTPYPRAWFQAWSAAEPPDPLLFYV